METLVRSDAQKSKSQYFTSLQDQINLREAKEEVADGAPADEHLYCKLKGQT